MFEARFRALPTRRLLGVEVPVAATVRSRLLGLALLDRERAGPGLWLPRCRSVHTFGMRFPLDLHFLDQAGEVIRRMRAVPPGRTVTCARAASVLELPAHPPGEGARSGPPGL